MKILMLVSFLLSGIPLYQDGNNISEMQSSGIKFFKGSWNEALVKSDKEHKLIFIDVATSWCGFCKKMKQNVFSDKEVAAYFNKNFINVEIDAEKEEGKTIAHQYGVTSFPTLIIANKDQQPVYTTEGYIGKDDFLKMAKSALALSKK